MILNATTKASAILIILVLALPMTLQASVLEQIAWARCSDGAEEALPKKITLLQVVNDKSFSYVSGVDIFLEAVYLRRFDATGGGVIVKGTVVKEDGTRMPLPKLVGKMRFGNAEDAKGTDITLERGDIIEWKVKLKGLHSLSGAGDCFAMDLLLVSGS